MRAAIEAFWQRYDTVVIGLSSAVLAAYCISEVMRRLDDRRRGRVGWPAMWAGLLVVVMLVTTDGEKFAAATPLTLNAPYLVGLFVLFQAGLWWFQLRHLREGGPLGASFLNAARSPAAMLLAVCAMLVGALWLIDKGVRDGGLTSNQTLELFLGKLAAIGVLAMATIQGIRSLLPVRGAFHRAALDQWVVDSCKQKAAEEKDVNHKNILTAIAEFAICAVVGRTVLQKPMSAVACAVVGGFVAMLSRDLVAIVKKARR